MVTTNSIENIKDSVPFQCNLMAVNYTNKEVACDVESIDSDYILMNQPYVTELYCDNECEYIFDFEDDEKYRKITTGKFDSIVCAGKYDSCAQCDFSCEETADVNDWTQGKFKVVSDTYANPGAYTMVYYPLSKIKGYKADKEYVILYKSSGDSEIYRNPDISNQFQSNDYEGYLSFYNISGEGYWCVAEVIEW